MKDKVTAVTGAASGIGVGKEIARNRLWSATNGSCGEALGNIVEPRRSLDRRTVGTDFGRQENPLGRRKR
ncbi:MAG: hypothetical protein ACM3O6_14180 [Acidobacteriota bacterium]